MFNFKKSAILFWGNYTDEHEIYLRYEADLFHGYFWANDLTMGDEERECEEDNRLRLVVGYYK